MVYKAFTPDEVNTLIRQVDRPDPALFRPWCRYYDGLANGPVCSGGVAYAEVVASVPNPEHDRFSLPDVPARLDVLPCFQTPRSAALLSCELRSYYSPVEQGIQRQTALNRARARVAMVTQGLCPDCAQPIQERQPAGSVTYAVPCGHVLYSNEDPGAPANPATAARG